LKNKSPSILDAQIKQGYLWTSNTSVNTDNKFENQLSEVENAAQKSFTNVTTNFLGNHKAEIYHDMVADLVQSYKAMGCNISFLSAFLRL